MPVRRPEPHVCRKSVAIMIGFERPVRLDSDVGGLLLRKRRELHSELVEMKPRNLLVEVLRKHVNVVLVFVALREKLDLRQHLVGEARAHDEARMPGRIAEIDEATL